MTTTTTLESALDRINAMETALLRTEWHRTAISFLAAALCDPDSSSHLVEGHDLLLPTEWSGAPTAAAMLRLVAADHNALIHAALAGPDEGSEP